MNYFFFILNKFINFSQHIPIFTKFSLTFENIEYLKIQGYKRETVSLINWKNFERDIKSCFQNS